MIKGESGVAVLVGKNLGLYWASGVGGFWEGVGFLGGVGGLWGGLGDLGRGDLGLGLQVFLGGCWLGSSWIEGL